MGVSAFGDLPASCPFLNQFVTVSSDGEHALVAASNDAAGNVEALKTRSFKIDNTPPVQHSGSDDRAESLRLVQESGHRPLHVRGRNLRSVDLPG